jgi:hypothetical protein
MDRAMDRAGALPTAAIREEQSQVEQMFRDRIDVDQLAHGGTEFVERMGD